MWNGKNLTFLRVKDELTESELAYIAGITTNNVKSYERGEKTPTKSEIRKFQKIFHVTEECFK